jgi:hypothetical protein
LAFSDFGCALSGQATKSTVLVRTKDLFMLILSWEANFFGPVVLQVGRQPLLGDFGCVLGGQATKSTVRVMPKDIFCNNFGQEWHLPSQHPGFGSKLSLKKVPGTCALLATLQSPVNLFRRAKLLELPHKFCTLSLHFCK